MKAKKITAMIQFAMLSVLVMGCSTISTGPEREMRLGMPVGTPVLRLEEVTEKLTGTWAKEKNAVGFRDSLLRALKQNEISAFFCDDPNALGTRIELVSDHVSDAPRLLELGTKSIATLGMAPLRYRSEWNIRCDVTLTAKGGQVVAKYPLHETGVYEIQTQGLSMFSLFGAGLGGDSAYKEIQDKTARNLVAKLGNAVAEDYDRLLGFHQDQSQKTQRQPRLKAAPPVILPTPSAKSWAVIIGISEYKYSGENGLASLVFADDDAKDFARVLKNLGWSKSYIKLILNEKATKRNIEIAFESWLSKAGPNDQIVLFWAGHGFPDPEDPERVYFACFDTDINIPVTGYRMDRVRASLEERKAKNVIILADTCHAGKIITRGNRGVSIISEIEKLKRDKAVPKGWIFMVGAETDRQAIEHTSWTNGAFTHSLINGLSGEADGFQSAGANDGIVTMGELRAYMNSAMPDETQKVLGVAKRPVITTSTGDPEIWNLTLQAD